MTKTTYNDVTTVYYSPAETAQLVRAALKAQFPRVRFSVKTHVYAGGATVNVKWTDGPTSDMVELVAKPFAGSTFDGSIDLKSSIHRVNEAGEVVRYGADFVSCHRSISEALGAKALVAVRRKFEQEFAEVKLVPADGFARLNDVADRIYLETSRTLLSEWWYLCAKMLPCGTLVEIKD